MPSPKVERYFIRKHGRIDGPFTKEDLRRSGIQTWVEVWNEDVFDWQDAGTFEQLQDVLDQRPPKVDHGLFQWVQRRVVRYIRSVRRKA